MGISLAVILGGWVTTASGQAPGVAGQVEKKIYMQKPAEQAAPVVQTQAIAPPAPQVMFQPLPPPQLQPLAPIGTPVNPGMQFVQEQTQPSVTTPGTAQEMAPVKVNLDPPKREDVFRFSDDETLTKRIRESAASKIKDLKLPEPLKSISGQAPPRAMPPMQVIIEPAYVNHRRLMFEQPNTERAGWELGLLQPVVSTLHFYKDCALWPHKLASNILEPYETSAGKCLPGSPTPLLLYPSDITIFGGTVGAGAIIGVAAILP